MSLNKQSSVSNFVKAGLALVALSGCQPPAQQLSQLLNERVASITRPETPFQEGLDKMEYINSMVAPMIGAFAFVSQNADGTIASGHGTINHLMERKVNVGGKDTYRSLYITATHVIAQNLAAKEGYIKNPTRAFIGSSYLPDMFGKEIHDKKMEILNAGNVNYIVSDRYLELLKRLDALTQLSTAEIPTARKAIDDMMNYAKPHIASLPELSTSSAKMENIKSAFFTELSFPNSPLPRNAGVNFDDQMLKDYIALDTHLKVISDALTPILAPDDAKKLQDALAQIKKSLDILMPGSLEQITSIKEMIDKHDLAYVVIDRETPATATVPFFETNGVAVKKYKSGLNLTVDQKTFSASQPDEVATLGIPGLTKESMPLINAGMDNITVVGLPGDVESDTTISFSGVPIVDYNASLWVNTNVNIQRVTPTNATMQTNSNAFGGASGGMMFVRENFSSPVLCTKENLPIILKGHKILVGKEFMQGMYELQNQNGKVLMVSPEGIAWGHNNNPQSEHLLLKPSTDGYGLYASLSKREVPLKEPMTLKFVNSTLLLGVTTSRQSGTRGIRDFQSTTISHLDEFSKKIGKFLPDMPKVEKNLEEIL